MSWQDYVDNQLIASQCVSKACIAGHDGGVWAKSDAFEVSFSWWCNQKIVEKVQKILFLLFAVATNECGLGSLFRDFLIRWPLKHCKTLHWMQLRLPRSKRRSLKWFVTTFFFYSDSPIGCVRFSDKPLWLKGVVRGFSVLWTVFDPRSLLRNIDEHHQHRLIKIFPISSKPNQNLVAFIEEETISDSPDVSESYMSHRLNSFASSWAR